jgi:hypothetical protein
MLGSSRGAAQLKAPQEGLSSVSKHEVLTVVNDKRTIVRFAAGNPLQIYTNLDGVISHGSLVARDYWIFICTL